MPRDTRRSLPIALLRAREAVMVRFRPMLAAHDITEQQWRVLRVVHETGAVEATELARRACVLAPSLTRIIRALEARGFIRRRRHKDDARRAVIEMTGDGSAFIHRVTPESVAIYDEMEALFGHAALAQLLDRLERLTETLSQ